MYNTKTRKEKRSILMAMVMGDGCLKKNNVLSITHCARQKDYLIFKAKLLAEVLEINVPKVYQTEHEYESWRFNKGHKLFRIYRNWIYKNDVKTFNLDWLRYITPQGLAIWYMDDGSLIAKKRNGKIHAFELYISTYLSKEENQVLIDWLFDTYQIKFNQNQNKGKYRLRCSTQEARKFVELVKPFIVPCLEYKVNMTRE